MLKKLFKVAVVCLIIASMVYSIQQNGVVDRLRNRFYPCTQPRTYSISQFDNKFKISRENLLSALVEAEKIWEEPTGKNLFEHAAQGKIAINLIYDSRQEATERLKKIGLNIDTTRTNYDRLKASYTSFESEYKRNVAQYERQAASFEASKAAYEKQVQYWNSKGGAPEGEYKKLEATQASLQIQANNLNNFQAKINEQVENLNALAGQLNQMAADLNLDVSRYNTIGSQHGEEFQEGVYRNDEEGEAIDIYQFDTQAQLIRLLAHEFGHALGIDHIEDKNAIMYRLNEAKNLKLTQADIVEINKVCKITN